MILQNSPCLPSIKDNGYLMTLVLPVFDQGLNQYLPLLFEVFMIDTDYIISINDYR